MKYIVAITRKRTSGFALVVTLSLLILLTTIALGFLSLASVSLRSSTQGEAMAIAHANARLSLMIALGELQRQAGPDTRVTARADILNPTNPPVLGVWRSWEGTNHETSGTFIGRPISPGSDYRTVKEGHFLAWLTSANSEDSLLASIPPNGTNNKITLLGKGSVGSGTDPITGVDRDKLQIHLPPTLVTTHNQPGGMAWWVGGENQKVRLPKPHKVTTTNPVLQRKSWAIMAKSHSVADPKPFSLNTLLTDASPADKAITLGQTDLLPYDKQSDSPRSQQHFHDLTTHSVGLLTNTATGGWRKDLSLLSESWDSQPTTNLPLFRVMPDPVMETQSSRASTTSWNAPGSLFYPWATYTDRYSGGLQQAVASWDNLIDFTRFYKRADVTTTTAGIRSLTGSSVPHYGGLNDTDRFNNIHKVRTFPVVARMQWVFSHFAEEGADDPANPGQKLHTPKMVMTPVISIWNPYDVTLTPAQNFNFELKILPVALSYQVGGTANPNYNSILYVNHTSMPLTNLPSLLDYSGGGGGGNKYATCTIQKSDMVLKPGETRVFSPVDNQRKVPGGGNPGGGHRLDLQPGVRFTGGHLYPVRNQAGQVGPMSAGTSIKANARFDTRYNAFTWSGQIIRADGAGVYLEMSPPKADGTWSDSIYTLHYRTSYSPEVANQLHPPITGNDMLSTSLGAVSTTPLPFMSAIFGTRMTTPTHDAVKGFVQCSPFGHFSPTYFRDTTQWQYAGTGHPINSRFDYSFIAHRSGGDDNLPNAGSSSNNGFIITGVQSSNGVPRAVIAELPSRPLASLGELVNWDLRYENPCPPFSFNLVGNSDASPLLPTDAVVNSTDSAKTDNFKNDDAYCANHLLFDDWFLSSITPDPAGFGSSGGKSQAVVFAEFVNETVPLANRAYRPIQEDKAFVANNPAAELYDDFVRPAESWKNIASRIEVEGMFNVNSTSVTAWRALLGHARNQRVPHIRTTSTSWNISLSAETQYPTSRFSIAGDVAAGSPPAAGVFPEATEFTGYRTLDDAFLDALAKEVVVQVRKRGPFLSLGEFINRQLSSGDLALAGALQAALNEVTKTPATNPLAVMQGHSTMAVANPVEGPNNEDKTGYVFPEAAVGYSSYGLPGWTRQADILRPLAPILTARDDTFTIRSYGDTRDASGKVIAYAVCEAVVRRTRDYVDTADAAETTVSLTSQVNRTFGRRFQILSFRWLDPEEI